MVWTGWSSIFYKVTILPSSCYSTSIYPSNYPGGKYQVRQRIEAIPSPKQQRRPLLALLSLSFFYGSDAPKSRFRTVLYTISVWVQRKTGLSIFTNVLVEKTGHLSVASLPYYSKHTFALSACETETTRDTTWNNYFVSGNCHYGFCVPGPVCSLHWQHFGSRSRPAQQGWPGPYLQLWIFITFLL